MGGFSGNSSGKDVVFAQNVDFSGQAIPSNTMVSNGQLLIGSTALNAGGTNINVGTLTSPDNSIIFGYSSPNITATANGAKIGETITGNTGGPLFPTGGNWNIPGNNTANNGFATYSTGSGSTLKINSYGTAKWVVNPVAGIGTHTTIGAALASASSGDTIFITPGTYTETLTLVAGVNLTTFSGEENSPNAHVIISGQLAVPATAGTYNLSNLYLTKNGGASGGIINAIPNAVIHVNVENCYFDMTHDFGFSFQSNNSTSTFTLRNCIGDVGSGNAVFGYGAGGNSLNFYNCNFTNSGNSTTTNLDVGFPGTISFYNSSMKVASSFSGTSVNLYNSILDCSAINTTPLTTTAGIIAGSKLLGGTASALSVSSASFIVTNSTFDSSNTHAITGSGQINYCGLSFSGSSSNMNITTQVPLVMSNNAVTVVTPGSYPYTTVPQDNLILVDTSSPRTIIPLASPTTGQVHRIKDNVGSGNSNNITITPSGKNIDGASSFVINTNYGSVDIVYNGTQWNVV